VGDEFNMNSHIPCKLRGVLTERRLRRVSRRIKRIREELRIADEQLLHFNDDADDARLRSLVSETPLADQEYREAEKTSVAMQRHHSELLEQLHSLETEQDDLLDRLSAQNSR
jgi:hypothetical protein